VVNRGPERLFVNDGAGDFTDETSRLFPPTSDSTRAGGLANLEGDGDLDVVTGNRTPAALRPTMGHAIL
jgi:hypothetical protein